jgi:hypothetical protein
MDRRKFLIGLGSTAAGGVAMMGTGAFSSTGTKQQRGLTAQVEGGASANLGISANTSNDFVSDGGRADALAVDFTADGSGQGLNINGVTEVRPAFTLTNNFSQDFYVEVYNPLRNNDIANTQINNATESQGAGSNSGNSSNRVEVPPGLDVQFIGATDNALDNGGTEGDVALIDRSDGPAAYDFQDPEDPSTFQVDLDKQVPSGGRIDYLSFGDEDSGYVKLTPGQSIDVVARAVVNERFLPNKNPSTLDNKLTSEFTIRAYNNESAMIFTDEVALDSKVP